MSVRVSWMSTPLIPEKTKQQNKPQRFPRLINGSYQEGWPTGQESCAKATTEMLRYRRRVLLQHAGRLVKFSRKVDDNKVKSRTWSTKKDQSSLSAWKENKQGSIAFFLSLVWDHFTALYRSGIFHPERAWLKDLWVSPPNDTGWCSPILLNLYLQCFVLETTVACIEHVLMRLMIFQYDSRTSISYSE